MLVTQRTIDQAKVLAEKRNSSREGELAFARTADRQILNSPSVDMSDYLVALIAAKLSGGQSIEFSKKNPSTKHSDVIWAVFDVDPIQVDGDQITVNEDDLLKPLFLKNYLVRAFDSKVIIHSLKFGCLEVKYGIERSGFSRDISVENISKAVREELSIKILKKVS